MTIKIFKLFVLGLAIPVAAQSQINTFTDEFDDASLDTTWNGATHTLWAADHPRTFALSESDGVLTIEYTRDNDSDAWDNFNFTPPAEVDVSGNPEITLDIKSDVATTYTLKPIYSNGNDRLIDKDVPGDGQWNTYRFQLQSSNYSGGNLTNIYMYLDGGSTTNTSGTVQFDNLKIAGFSINITTISAKLINGTQVVLNWDIAGPYTSSLDHYNVYRSSEAGFPISSETRIAEVSDTTYQDSGLEPYEYYYYKVTAVDQQGEEHIPSRELSIRTYDQDEVPVVSMESVNADPVGTYEKFEINVGLENGAFQNPYNPGEIDLRAWFESPSGDTTRVNGFYDNYNGADQWRVRFSPDEAGEWEYKILATDLSGTGESETYTFTAAASEHKGWLDISRNNPNYLMYADSTTFYGMAAYYPWNVTENGLDRFKAAGGNIFGYWNSTYDNEGNGGGNSLIESVESGLGRYDQQKSGRIDQLLSWAKERDLKIMLAVWAHDWLRYDGQPWPNGRFAEQNPYRQIVDAGEFYTDSLAWEYQKRQYRYIIARWGHSRALGIWEIINEIHGTTGYQQDAASARAWINKVHRYFKEHDPYKRPTTASLGGYQDWLSEDIQADMPNLHYYEAQGYPRPYSNDVRNGLYNIVDSYEGLKRAGDRPAILGEAGYTSMFSDVSSDNYTQEFHNAFWAGLANGMATTPFWWEFNMDNIFTDERMQTYGHLKAFANEFDFANRSFSSLRFEVPEADIYGLKSDSIGFSWMRIHQGNNVSGMDVRIRRMSQKSYGIAWYDTWTGDIVQTDTLASIRDMLKTEVPELDEGRRDIAVKFHTIKNGDTPAGLRLFFVAPEINSRPDETRYTLICYLEDEAGRLVTGAEKNITFSVEGPGSLSSESVTTAGGVASVEYILNSGDNGEVSITAEAEGVDSYTLGDIAVTDIAGRPDKAGHPKEYSLSQNYPNPFNPSTNISYQIPENSQVNLSIYDLTGRKIRTLVNKRQTAGNYTVRFKAGHLSSGVYIYRLQTDSFTRIRRMTLIK